MPALKTYDEYVDQFERDLKLNALSLQFSEGLAYIDSDLGVVASYFSGLLTERMYKFYAQYGKEKLQGFSDDGGLTISPVALADRIGFWDNFVMTYPNHLMMETIKDRRNTFLFYFITGMDNTPAFDYESKALNIDFKKAYEYYVESYESTPAAAVVKQYLALLEKSGYQQSESIDKFLKDLRVE